MIACSKTVAEAIHAGCVPRRCWCSPLREAVRLSDRPVEEQAESALGRARFDGTRSLTALGPLAMNRRGWAAGGW